MRAFSKGLKLLKIDLNSSDEEKLFELIDNDNDGRVRYNEFAVFVNGTRNKKKAKSKTKKQLHAEQLLKQALENDGGQPWNRSKLMLVGEGRAGKTTVLRSLMGKRFVEMKKAPLA